MQTEPVLCQRGAGQPDHDAAGGDQRRAARLPTTVTDPLHFCLAPLSLSHSPVTCPTPLSFSVVCLVSLERSAPLLPQACLTPLFL